MHGCSLGNASLVNAEVDSMGGVFDSGLGIEVRSSPHRAAIEKAQADLRREYDVREERRRELDYLEKGGNPLDFKFGNAASVSVQSTSLTDQPSEQLVTSEAKGSFALTASPPGDSVESSGRPEAPVVSEPNCADNLLLFDGENESVDGGRSSIRFVRSRTAPSEQTSQLDSDQNAKELGESPVFGLPKSRAYKRRNRSRPNREGARSSSTDIVPSREVHASSLPSRDSQKDMKGSVLDTDNRQTQNASLNHKSKPTISNGAVDPTDLPSAVVDMVVDSGQAVDSNTGSTVVGVPKNVPDCEQNLVSSPKSSVGKEPSAVVSEFPESVEEEQLAVSPHLDCAPLVSMKSENQTGLGQQNGSQDAEGDEGRTPIAVENCSTSLPMEDLDLGSRCTETGLGLDKTSDILVNGLISDDIIESTGVEVLITSESPNVESVEKLNSKDEKEADDRYSPTQDKKESVCKGLDIVSSLKPEEELAQHGSGSQEEANHTISVEEMKVDGISTSDIKRKSEDLTTDNLDPAKENVCSGRLGGSTDKPAHDSSSEKESAHKKVHETSVPEPRSQPALPSRESSDAKHEVLTETQMKLDVRAREDSILKEAQVIEAKRKRIAQLSVAAFTSENHQKSQWDLVLEEMAWLSNDFIQERIWKKSVAAQLSNRVASASRERLTVKSSLWKQKEVAHTLSKAVMEFWLSAEELSKESTMQSSIRNSSRGVQEYAVRYLKHNTSLFSLCLAELPATPERLYELESQEMSWEERFTEEYILYTVPLGSMGTYSKAIESHLAKIKRTGSSIQEEVETSLNGATAGHGSQGNTFEEDEGETNTYLPEDVESGKPLKFALKKRNLIISSSAKSYDKGTNLPFMQRIENKFGTPQPGLTVKRPANNVHVSSIPTKRMRTAPRPRFTTPLTAGTSGGNQVPNKPDGSSGDNNSFQDDHSTFLGGSQIPDNMEVESVADFEMQLPFDSAESKPKKKKKPKHQGSTYEQRWQHGNNFQNELGGYSRKRYDKLVESNGSSGLYGQPIMKKQKMMRQPMDSSLDKYSPVAGSIPSPVASQMSNMAHSNKLVKILGGGNRGRKGKSSLKIHVGQSGPGSLWSSFEEQALIVLVHDLGPNWELISDAINNILQYKCIFRKPKECSEHHKELLSRTTGDGADSAEDSGSSQPYPSTLPGIPKGSARALFQRLQEPIEEDMIKVHFEKIIQMSHNQQRFHKMQNQEQKPVQPHISHAVALSQACPNNISGGPVLTPLDLYDLPDSSPDVLSGGYQGTLSGGLATSTQSGSASLHPTSGVNSVLQGCPSMVHGNNFSSPSNSSMRDGRYVMPRSASLSVDDQRMQQYNQAMPGRVAGTSSGADRGVRMIAGGNGMGVMCGMNRNMSTPRPGFPGMAPSSVLNSGMLPSNMPALTEPANLHSGVGASPGNSILRPRDSSNMMRPTQIPQHQRQMMVPDHQMQATQGNIQGGNPLGGISGGFQSQTSPSSSQSHPFHHQQHRSSQQQQAHVHDKTHHPHLQGANHASSSQHQAYAIRLAKERHAQMQQQRMLHQQQLASSSGIMPRGPPQTQGSLQNSSHVQPSASVSVSAALTPSSSPMPPMSQHQQKPHMPAHGLIGNSQSGGNRMGKQRQRQLPQQLQNSHPHSSRQHPQQRTHPQHHAKLVKGAGRGNMGTHQNLTVEPSILNGLSQTTGSQSTEKGEQVTNMMQGQGSYPGSGNNPSNPLNKPLSQQQKILSGQAMASSKQSQQQVSHLEKKNQGLASPSTSGNTLPTSQQAASPSVTSSSNCQQLQPTQKLANPSQAPVQRVLQQNRQLNSDSLASKLQADQIQSEQLHVTNSCINPSQLGSTEISSHPSGELVIVKPVVPSTSGTQGKEPEQQYPIVSKTASQSAPIGNSLTSLSRTQSQEGRASLAIPTQTLDVGLQRLQQKSQLQMSSSPPPLPLSEQLPLPAQQLQTGTNNLHVNPGSADNRLD